MGFLDGTADVLLGEDTTARRQADDVADELGDGDVVGAADDFTGQMDESVGRQFDDEAGGGFADVDTYVAIATGANTEDTPGDVPGRFGDWIGGATGTNPHEEGEPNPLGPAGRILEWIVANPAKVGLAIVALYVAPLFASALDVVANVTEG